MVSEGSIVCYPQKVDQFVPVAFLVEEQAAEEALLIEGPVHLLQHPVVLAGSAGVFVGEAQADLQ